MCSRAVPELLAAPLRNHELGKKWIQHILIATIHPSSGWRGGFGEGGGQLGGTVMLSS